MPQAAWFCGRSPKERANGERANGERANGKRANGKRANGKRADGKRADADVPTGTRPGNAPRERPGGNALGSVPTETSRRERASGNVPAGT